MLCGFTCLISNSVLHRKIDLFRIGFFIKIEEPTVLGINMFSAPSLTLKSIMITLLYWAVIQTVGFIFFQMKAFWFGWRSIDIWPIDFALLAHFASLAEHLTHTNNQWQIKELHIYLHLPRHALTCPSSLLLCKIHDGKMQANLPKQVRACPVVCFIKKDFLIWEQSLPFTDRNSGQISPK